MFFLVNASNSLCRCLITFCLSDGVAVAVRAITGQGADWQYSKTWSIAGLIIGRNDTYI